MKLENMTKNRLISKIKEKDKVNEAKQSIIDQRGYKIDFLDEEIKRKDREYRSLELLIIEINRQYLGFNNH